jgi:hypothetical protein
MRFLHEVYDGLTLTIAELTYREITMTKPTQGGKSGQNSSLEEAKGSKSSAAGNSGSGKGNSQSAKDDGKSPAASKSKSKSSSASKSK